MKSHKIWWNPMKTILTWCNYCTVVITISYLDQIWLDEGMVRSPLWISKYVWRCLKDFKGICPVRKKADWDHLGFRFWVTDLWSQFDQQQSGCCQLLPLRINMTCRTQSKWLRKSSSFSGRSGWTLAAGLATVYDHQAVTVDAKWMFWKRTWQF